jgi:lipoate-protein ligase A
MAMRTLDFIVQPHITSRHSLAADSHFLHVVGRPSRLRSGVLRIYDLAGPWLSIGRYHLAPGPTGPGRCVQLHRRYSGGRTVPFGDGFVGLALVLPQRSALFSADPFALAPYQVMNRYVRGILEGCKLVNVRAFYPGRDFVTVDRRLLALVSFEVDRSGALLFEAVIANHRDFSGLPEMLEQVDASGVIQAEMLAPESTTCLSRELGTDLATEEVAELLRRGFEKQFNLFFEEHVLTSLEEQAIAATAAHEFQDTPWLQQRQLRPDFDHHASARVQLGAFETYFSLEQDRFIKDVTFAGDFIANSPAIERLEHDLRLCPAEWRAIDAVAAGIFSQPENYILGIGHSRTIADTICKGLAA